MSDDPNQTVINFKVTGQVRISREGILTNEECNAERDYIECAMHAAAEHAAANYNVFLNLDLGPLEGVTVEDA